MGMELSVRMKIINTFLILSQTWTYRNACVCCANDKHVNKKSKRFVQKGFQTFRLHRKRKTGVGCSWLKTGEYFFENTSKVSVLSLKTQRRASKWQISATNHFTITQIAFNISTWRICSRFSIKIFLLFNLVIDSKIILGLEQFVLSRWSMHGFYEKLCYLATGRGWN